MPSLTLSAIIFGTILSPYCASGAHTLAGPDRCKHPIKHTAIVQIPSLPQEGLYRKVHSRQGLRKGRGGQAGSGWGARGADWWQEIAPDHIPLPGPGLVTWSNEDMQQIFLWPKPQIAVIPLHGAVQAKLGIYVDLGLPSLN